MLLPSSFTSSLLTIARPRLLTIVLFASSSELSCILNDSFDVPGTITSLGPRSGNLTAKIPLWSIVLGTCVLNKVQRMPLIPFCLRSLRWGLSLYPYSEVIFVIYRYIFFM